MKQTVIKTYRNLRLNLRTLIYFEILYRLLGVFIIFPLVRLLFLLSMRLSGYVYITNLLLLDFLFKPTTIVMMIILGIILSLYIAVEIIFLALIFDFGYHNQEIDLKNLLLIGLKRAFNVIRKYHILIILPSFMFFVFVEFLHLIGIFSTISFPDYVITEIKNMPVLLFSAVFILLVIIFGCLETIFTINIFTLEHKKIRRAYIERRKLLRKRRFRMFFEFSILNLLLNGILYGFYFLVIAIVSGFIFITFGQELVLGFLLTILYALYIVVGFITSIIIIPINYGLVSTWYYDAKEKLESRLIVPNIQRSLRKPISIKWVKKGLLITLLVIFLLNITSVISVVRQSKSQIEFFNYSLIIAHRGASNDAPENTIASIELAIEQGADYVEFDVRETIDLVPILMHDTTLGRTTNDTDNRLVSQVSLDYIKNLDAGGWFSTDYIGEQVPTLEEVLQAIKGRGKAFIELKVNTPTINESVVRLVEEYNMVDDVKIMSFSSSQLKAIKELNSDIQTVYIIANFFGNITALINDENINNFAFEKHIIENNPHFIEIIHQQEKMVFVWTVNSEDRLRMVVNNDIDGIITSQPILAREIVYSKNKQNEFQELLRLLFSR